MWLGLAASTAFAIIGVIAPNSAGAAGTGVGYGGGQSYPWSGGATSIFGAKYFDQQGGTLTAKMHHGTISVTVPSGSLSQSVQCIVTASDKSSSNSRDLLQFSLLAEQSGIPDESAGPIVVTYAGPQVSTGAHVEVLTGGKTASIASSQIGHRITFVFSPNHTFAILKK